MNRIFCLCVLTLVLLIVVTSVAIGQSQFSIPIFFQGTGASDTCRLWFGVSGDGPGGAILDNTNCQDTDISYGSWVENCDPPSVWDFHAAFLIPDCSPACTVLYPYDFRGFTSPDQVDTYLINVTGDHVSNSQVTITWPSLSVLKNAGGPSSLWRLYKKVGPNYIRVVDMTTTTSYIDLNTAAEAILQYRIDKHGARIQIPGPEFVFKYNSYMYGNPFHYGNVRFGGSATTPVQVWNRGEMNALIISSVTVPANYTVTPNPPESYPITIAPGAIKNFDVTFTPPSIGGPFAGNIVFTHNASGGTTNLSVSGYGEDGDIVITPTLEDTVFTVISGDTVTIWNANVEENCGAEYKITVDVLEGNRIIVTERDTTFTWFQCGCLYNLSTNIVGLSAGTYTINVYRNLWGLAGTHIGTTSLTIGGGAGAPGSSQKITQSEMDMSTEFYQSECFGTYSNLSVNAGWKLVSVPRVPSNYSANFLFPAKYGSMFKYDQVLGDYVEAPILAIGEGYWVYHTSATSAIINGVIPINPKVNAKAGWNLIGSNNTPMPVSSLQLSDGAVIYGEVFRYDPVLGDYQPTTEINTGEAIWIYVTKDCTITFLSSL